jgi:uncharacterized membrane protein YhhN
MNNKTWIVLFLVTLTLNIAGSILLVALLESITKPLLLLILLNWFIGATDACQSPLKKWITGALCFSWLGDVLLMFQGRDSLFFLLGLTAFLIAHLFYIVCFHSIKTSEGIKSRFALLLPVVLYYVLLISLLYPHLKDMKIPVPVYGLVISFMLLLALHMLFSKNRTAGRFFFIGALLFVISDSVLAIDKFYQPFGQAGVIIMLTYGLAQLLIVKGAIEYISSKEKTSTSPS